MSDVPEGDAAAAEEGPTEDVMELLAEHVPLALLVDLAVPEGPASAEILRAEGMPGDAWWEPDGGAGSDAGPSPDSGSAAEVDRSSDPGT